MRASLALAPRPARRPPPPPVVDAGDGLEEHRVQIDDVIIRCELEGETKVRRRGDRVWLGRKRAGLHRAAGHVIRVSIPEPAAVRRTPAPDRILHSGGAVIACPPGKGDDRKRGGLGGVAGDGGLEPYTIATPRSGYAARFI